MPDKQVLNDEDIKTSWQRGAGLGASASTDPDTTDPDGTDADGTDGQSGDSDTTDN